VDAYVDDSPDEPQPDVCEKPRMKEVKKRRMPKLRENY